MDSTDPKSRAQLKLRPDVLNVVRRCAEISGPHMDRACDWVSYYNAKDAISRACGWDAPAGMYDGAQFDLGIQTYLELVGYN